MAGEYGFKKLFEEFIGDNPVKRESYNLVSTEVEFAGTVYDLRTRKGWSYEGLQKQLLTETPSIQKVEDADTGGLRLKAINNIAFALGCKVKIVFEPLDLDREEKLGKRITEFLTKNNQVPQVPGLTTGEIQKLNQFLEKEGLISADIEDGVSAEPTLPSLLFSLMKIIDRLRSK